MGKINAYDTTDIIEGLPVVFNDLDIYGAYNAVVAPVDERLNLWDKI